MKWPSGLRGAEVRGSVCPAREMKQHPGKERGLGSCVMLSQRLMPLSSLKLLFFMLRTPGWGPGSSQHSPRSALAVCRALSRRPGWDTKVTHSHSLCSPWKPICSLLSTRSLILHRGRDLPCTAASDAHHFWRSLVICGAQFKPLLCSSIGLFIYGKANFCSPRDSFSKKEHFSSRCQECKTKPSDWCLAACERGWEGREKPEFPTQHGRNITTDIWLLWHTQGIIINKEWFKQGTKRNKSAG